MSPIRPPTNDRDYLNDDDDYHADDQEEIEDPVFAICTHCGVKSELAKDELSWTCRYCSRENLMPTSPASGRRAPPDDFDSLSEEVAYQLKSLEDARTRRLQEERRSELVAAIETLDIERANLECEISLLSESLGLRDRASVPSHSEYEQSLRQLQAMIQRHASFVAEARAKRQALRDLS
jgi:hypothetical protein